MKTIAYLSFSLFLFCFSSTSMAQTEVEKDWHHKDPTADKTYGVSTQKAYNLLKDRKPTKVIVAILDSGVDTDHEDLQANIWVNTNEVAGNGIDDDGNGYIDDMHGWNFLGNADGVNLDHANLEMTRIFRKLSPKFQEVESAKEVDKTNRAEYKLFAEVKSKLLEELNETGEEFAQMDGFRTVFNNADSVAKKLFGQDYKLEDLAEWKPVSETNLMYQGFLSGLMKDENFSKKELDDYHEYLREKLEYYYNPRFKDREIIGDDEEKTDEQFYGNNNVWAPHNDHGTHVAGIVGAVNNNQLGMDGICRNVELMIVRTVPNGDEFDKDVANAIRYAADNGAHIINMSFGKAYSPQLEAVHEAIRYAEEKDVLMIHAAGNEANNLDKTANFPNPNYGFQKAPCATWLTVGASSANGDETLPGVFSNYGKKKVDIFAPGVQIYSSKPDNTYEFADGTSMAAPVVSGVAALIRSYFPQITAVELKELLLQSSNNYGKLSVLLPSEDSNATKTTKFKKLSVSGGVVNAYNAVKLAMQQFDK